MVCGFPLLCQVISVPGQVVLTERRRHLLATADAVVYVCDSAESKVEMARDGFDIIYVGHEGHDEAVGTVAEAPSSIRLIEPETGLGEFQPKDPAKVALLAQTTLGTHEWMAVMDDARLRFPELQMSRKSDLCYATTNRQEAVKRVAAEVDAMIVVGAPNSSNSQRLREVAERGGCPYAVLVQRAADIDWSRLGTIRSLGVTAGASAPEVLIDEVIAAFGARFDISVEVVTTTTESIAFNLPRQLRDAAE